MPDNLETLLSKQDLADLIEYLLGGRPMTGLLQI